MDELKKSQESAASAIEVMQKSQESTATLIENSKLEVLTAVNEKVAVVEQRMELVENKVDSIEENLAEQVVTIKEDLVVQVISVEERLSDKINAMERKMAALETRGDQPFLTGNSTGESVPQILRSNIKLPEYDGKSSWSVYKRQFEMVALANNWDNITKASHLAASLRGSAAEILQSFSPAQIMDCCALLNALDLRFGENHLKDYHRLQMKSRQQKTGETLQELATDIERLTTLAYPDCPADVRESLGLQCFLDAVRDAELQQALRLADCKDLRSALVYGMKFESAQNASRRERRPIRGARVENENSNQDLTRVMSSFLEELERKMNPLLGRQQKNGRAGPIKCWNCGEQGHLKARCPHPPAMEPREEASRGRPALN